MKVKTLLKRTARKLPRDYVLQYFPRGLDPFIDLKVSLPDYRIENIFDIGANVGQSSQDYNEMFPSAQIYSFEPVTESYQHLLENCGSKEQIRCYQIALSSSTGEGKILANSTSRANHLVHEKADHLSDSSSQVEKVAITTLDSFCAKENVDQISYLKIDTEGEDYEVLKGAKRMLDHQNIDLVEVEAGMYSSNEYHIPFEIFKNFLEKYNYYLFGIYTQTEEFFERKPYLRRANPLFISHDTVKKAKT